MILHLREPRGPCKSHGEVRLGGQLQVADPAAERPCFRSQLFVQQSHHHPHAGEVFFRDDLAFGNRRWQHADGQGVFPVEAGPEGAGEDGSVNLQSEDCYANLMALLSVPRSQQADLLETSLERR